MNKPAEIGYSPERRLKPRFICDYPALIQGFDENGLSFQEKGRAINLSRNGVNIVMNREILIGMELSISLAFNTNLLQLETPRLILHGTVVRGQFLSDTLYQIAIKFQEYKFI
ncbi:MAG TPA: PilZ domain-containing protein [Leptolinea sp.]